MEQPIILDFGIYQFSIDSQLANVRNAIDILYPEIVSHTDFADYNVTVRSPSNLRRLFKPQVEFLLDTQKPFLPLPANQAHPLLEWGMNWCVTSNEQNYLIIHAAVLAKDNKAIVCPAPPGSGKSTLTAFFAYSGWRLLSDELAIIELDTLTVRPFVRPICLKNASIDLVSRWFPDVSRTPSVDDTTKGTVAHFKAPTASIEAKQTPAEICAVIYPQYTPNVEATLDKLSMAVNFEHLVNNSFNHNVLGERGFSSLVNIVEQCPAFYAQYSDLAELQALVTERCGL